MKKLIVATSNPGKLRELQEYLTELEWELRLKPEEIDIEETGETFMANACLKASQVALAVGEWAIADDSGLSIHALGGAPGLYSARYGNSDQDRINRVLKELGDNPNRQAKFICAIAIARPDGSMALAAEGVCQGEILATPRGNKGFGYDPIFYVPTQQMTFAQMAPEIKQKISHRGKAFEILLPSLKELLINT